MSTFYSLPSTTASSPISVGRKIALDSALLNAPHLGPLVLEVLAAKQALPSQGIVAGQSVASALVEIFRTGRPAYNDIDVFLSEAQWKNQLGDAYGESSLMARLTDTVEYKEPYLKDVDDYERTWAFAERTHYSVNGTHVDGLINRVRVQWGASAGRGGARVGSLIRGFDANNVQVGIDIESGKLVHTPAFDEFFRTRELKLVSVYTPVQSLLRFLKKKSELDVYGNDSLHLDFIRRLVYLNELDPIFREARIEAFKGGLLFIEKSDVLAACRRTGRDLDSWQRAGAGTANSPLAFGKKYRDLFIRFESALEPYFELTQHANKNIWLLSSRPGAPRLGYKGELPLTPSRQATRLWQMGLPAPKLVKERRAAFERFVFWLPSPIRPSYEAAYRTLGDEYLEGCESQTGWRELQAVVGAHEEFRCAVLPLPIGQQIALFRMMRRAFKKANVEPAWGLFANKSVTWVRELLATPALAEQRVAALLGSTAPLVARKYLLPLTALENTTVRELNSDLELVAEGNRMRHCVGGYGDEVRFNDSRIISLKAGLDRTEQSTIEWALSGAIAWPAYPSVVSLRQQHTFRDETPSKLLRNLEQKYRESINDWLRANLIEGLSLALRVPTDEVRARLEHEKLAFEAEQHEPPRSRSESAGGAIQ